jgi:hypothetical protein
MPNRPTTLLMGMLNEMSAETMMNEGGKNDLIDSGIGRLTKKVNVS